MAAKIGILGETTVGTSATLTTLYTVPADKAARIRVLSGTEGGAGVWMANWYPGTPNDEILLHLTAAANADIWTGSNKYSSPNPADSITMSANGLMEGAAALDLSAPGATGDWLIAPLVADYILSTGDTVKFRVEDAHAIDSLAQVIGAEDDA